MIAFLKGILEEITPTLIVLDVNGIGYEVLVPLSTSSKLVQMGESVKLYTHFSVREDAQTLYGFYTLEEKKIFKLLINSVSGVGPKMALNILSGMDVSAFCSAVCDGDVKALSRISGIGKKTAERIVVELKDKIGTGLSRNRESGTKKLSDFIEIQSVLGDTRLQMDAVSALTNLGFRQNEAEIAVKSAMTMLGENASLQDIIKASLKK